MKNIRLFAVLLVLSSLCPSVRAQDFPYTLETDREVALITLGGLASATSHLIESELPGLSPGDLSTQTTGRITRFDFGATRQKSEAYRQLSDQLLRTSFLVPATLFTGRRARSKPCIIGVMALQTALLNESFTKVVKVAVRRNRPYTHNPAFEADGGFGNDARQSFVSGHTSNTAALSFFTAKVFHDLYPDSKLRPYVWTAAALLPAASGYARYRAGKHFPTDIIAGYALGASLGILIPQLHKPKKGAAVRFGTTSEGLGMVWALR